MSADIFFAVAFRKNRMIPRREKKESWVPDFCIKALEAVFFKLTKIERFAPTAVLTRAGVRALDLRFRLACREMRMTYPEHVAVSRLAEWVDTALEDHVDELFTWARAGKRGEIGLTGAPKLEELVAQCPAKYFKKIASLNLLKDRQWKQMRAAADLVKSFS